MIGTALHERYRGLDTASDALIEQYCRVERDVDMWHEQISQDGLMFAMAGGSVQSHPLIVACLQAERLLAGLTREIRRIVALLEGDDEDEFDAFLHELNRTNRPHRSRHRAE